MKKVIVELKNIRKEFPGVIALDDMSLQLKQGEIHGLIGENGAGKSTLIKTLTGVYTPDQGQIEIEGEAVNLEGPADAKRRGVACVYQELNIVKELSIVDNIFMGSYAVGKSGLLDYKYMKKRVREILDGMGQDVPEDSLCQDVGMGCRQMVEIGKAILLESKVLILDEPTSSLGEKETAELFRILRLLRAKGIAILFVSHRLEELFEICDTVTVMRDGKHIITKPSQDLTKDELITHMVGRTLDNLYPKIKTEKGETVLEVSHMSRKNEYQDISFSVCRGEILGFSGLVGAGRTEVMQGIFGIKKNDSGEIKIHGKPVTIRRPSDAIRNGIAFLTEDRKQQGLVLQESVERNLSLVNVDKLKKKIFIDEQRIHTQAEDNIERLKIRTSSAAKPVKDLSGGNQQKVVIGKWMNSDADIYIFDEPTRGIDVGAKIEVYNVMNELVQAGKCIIMVSSELPEILGMCDRVIVMREGRIMGTAKSDSVYFNQESIMKAAWGGKMDE